jgi:hypothetical protein
MRGCYSIGIGLVLVTVHVLAGDVGAQTVSAAVKQDVSPALSSIPAPPPKAQAAFQKIHRVKRIPAPPALQAAAADTALQPKAAAALPIGPIDVVEGIGEGLVVNGQRYQVTSFPADTTGAAGTTQYVQWVNTSLVVFDKSTKQPVLGPVDGSTLWRGFGGNCEHFNDGDPIVLFDRTVNRWVLSQFSVSGSPFSQCIAISTSADATGTYHRYEFQYPDFNDYGKFGIWPDAYYASFNIFGSNNAFKGSKVCAFERVNMIAGGPSRMICFDVSGQGGLVPADLDGTSPPPAGSPNYVMNIGSDRLNMWRFKVDWVNPSASALTGPVVVKTAPFRQACGDSGTCIVQPKTTQRLDSLGDRLMYRLAYRNFGTHESIVATHSVAVTPTRAAVRWYEVRNPGGTPQVQQQGTYAPTTSSRWMGSAAMDKMGNMAVGYTVSSGSIFPSIRVAGRLATDPPNKLSAEKSIAAATGKGAQKESDRWGDYSTMTLDPTDDCTFWYTAQYQADGVNQWHSAVIRFKFAACQ